ERRRVHLVEGLALCQSFADHAARLPARLSLVLQERAAHDGLTARCRREVAFGRDADDVLPEVEGEANLRRGGEERNDPHSGRSPDSPGPLKVFFNQGERRPQGDWSACELETRE